MSSHFRRRSGSASAVDRNWIRSCISIILMSDTNVVTQFASVAREIFSMDAAIRWIALEDAGGRPQFGWRDPEARPATAREQPFTVDPLILMLAENQHDMCCGGNGSDSNPRF